MKGRTPTFTLINLAPIRSIYTEISIHLHIPIKFSESFPKKETYDKKHKGIAKPNWTNDEKKKKYANLVSGKIPNISPIDIMN